MFDALFDELAAMKDAWDMNARDALRFIAENRDMYDGEVGEEFDYFTEVMAVIIEEAEGAVYH